MNDLWTLRGVTSEADDAPVWLPLELPGPVPVPRKGHSLAGTDIQRFCCLQESSSI